MQTLTINVVTKKDRNSLLHGRLNDGQFKFFLLRSFLVPVRFGKAEKTIEFSQAVHQKLKIARSGGGCSAGGRFRYRS